MSEFRVTLRGMWEAYRERVGAHVMYCCRRPEGYEKPSTVDGMPLPYAHVYIMEFNGLTDGGELDLDGHTVEHYRLEDKAPLELHAIAHAMREKYSAR